ncbi:MAG: transporter substrate-binding domain-containing protein [Butyrivibrio sp.]|nr:transporter substrate-binding domain-containing protein [Butyrivibrio sp.]
MKKKILATLISSAIAVASLTACGSQGAESASAATTQKEEAAEAAETTPATETTEAAAEAEATGDDLLNEIKERGYIIVGTEGTWSPYTYHDDNDELVGFDVEVAKYIADYIGVDVQYSETVWGSMFASLDAGQIDVVINSVSYSDERAEKYDFSEPYNYSQHAFLALKDNDEVNTLEDAKGKTAANDPTSSIGKYAEDNGAILDEVGEAAQAVSEVRNGRADLTFGTTVGFADYLKQHPEDEEVFKVVVTSDPEPNAYIPVVKGNEELVKVINEALAQAREDGTLSALALKYFDLDTTQG